MKILLVIVGTFFVGLGVVGAFVPVLPTTPFLLLAAGCYARSSERFYHHLMDSRILGGYLRNYREGRGMTRRAKVFTLVVLWVGIGYSAVWAVEATLVRAILFLIAVGVSAHILLIPTCDPGDHR